MRGKVYSTVAVVRLVNNKATNQVGFSTPLQYFFNNERFDFTFTETVTSNYRERAYKAHFKADE